MYIPRTDNALTERLNLMQTIYVKCALLNTALLTATTSNMLQRRQAVQAVRRRQLRGSLKFIRENHADFDWLRN